MANRLYDYDTFDDAGNEHKKITAGRHPMKQTQVIIIPVGTDESDRRNMINTVFTQLSNQHNDVRTAVQVSESGNRAVRAKSAVHSRGVKKEVQKRVAEQIREYARPTKENAQEIQNTALIITKHIDDAVLATCQKIRETLPARIKSIVLGSAVARPQPINANVSGVGVPTVNSATTTENNPPANDLFDDETPAELKEVAEAAHRSEAVQPQCDPIDNTNVIEVPRRARARRNKRESIIDAYATADTAPVNTARDNHSDNGSHATDGSSDRSLNKHMGGIDIEEARRDIARVERLMAEATAEVARGPAVTRQLGSKK